MKMLSAPTDIFLSITHMCNLNCYHCSVYPSDYRNNELTTKELFSLICKLADMKVFTIRISGGEPFLRRDLLLIIEHIVNNNMRLSINTNAMFITKKIVKKLADYSKRIDDIMVSIDGSRAEIHERLRTTGSFAKTIHGIQQLTDAGLNVSAYTTVVKYNLRDIENIIKLCRKLKIQHIKFNELLPLGMGLKYYHELGLTYDERSMIIKKLQTLSKKYNGLIEGTYLQVCEMFSPMAERNNTLSLSGCGATLNSLTILPDGTVVPCDRLQNFVLGNIREKSISEIWHSSPQIKKFRNRFNKTLKDIKECADCKYKNRCTGGCPAIPFYLEGRLLGRDPLSCYKVYAGIEDFPWNLITRRGIPTRQPSHRPHSVPSHGVRVKNLVYF